MPSDPSAADAAPAAPPSTGPDHRDLYLIVAGIVLGIALGPGVLGRLNPDLYQRWFIGPSFEQELLAYQQELDAHGRNRALVEATGATPAALEEFDRREGPRIEELRGRFEQAMGARGDRSQWFASRAMALVLAILVVMILETLVDPRALATRGRLATARYALISLWLALTLAQPAFLRSIPLSFLVVVVAVVLAAALVPLRRKVQAQP